MVRHRPELIVCPMLKSMIPESVFTRHRCLIVHPGPRGGSRPVVAGLGDRARDAAEWGVTVLEATAAVDGGDVWATRTFATRAAGKSSLYRHEVRRAAVEAVVEAVTRVAEGSAVPEPLDYADPRVTGRLRPLLAQAERAIDWGVGPHRHGAAPDQRRGGASRRARRGSAGASFHLFGAHDERRLRGRPGELVAQRHGAVCRATVDGAVWITHLKAPGGLQAPRRPRARGRRCRARRAGVPAPSTPRYRRTTRFATSSTTSAAASATCPSTSTTAP